MSLSTPIVGDDWKKFPSLNWTTTRALRQQDLDLAYVNRKIKLDDWRIGFDMIGALASDGRAIKVVDDP